MSYSTNYPSLRAELQTYVEDNSAEYQAQLDNIIQRGSDNLQRALDLDFWREQILDHIPFNKREFARPDCIRIRSIFLVDAADFLLPRSYDFCRMHNGRGLPRFWCERNPTTIYVSPTSDQNYTIEYELLTRLPALGVTNPTNWLTDNVADMLLLSCLAESEQFLAAPERVGEFVNTLQMKVQMYQAHRGGARRSPVAMGA